MLLERIVSPRTAEWGKSFLTVRQILGVLMALLLSGCNTSLNEAPQKLLHPKPPKEHEEAFNHLRQREDTKRRSGKWPIVDKLDSVPINQRLFEVLWYNYGLDMYVQKPMGVDLKSGGIVNIGGLEAQRLRFRLPFEYRRSWSKDGKTLYVVSSVIPEAKHSTYKNIGWVLRIDTSTWTATHGMRLQLPLGVSHSIRGIELTSEGLLVSLRARYPLEIYAEGERGKKDNPTVNVALDHLAVLDPDTLALSKLYLGPSEKVTGSPNSSVVCVSGLDVIAALVDLRDGTVLDRIDKENRDKRIPGIENLNDATMSPDGNTVYFNNSPTDELLPFDISKGKFEPLSPIPYFGETDSTLPRVYVSPDGRQAGVVCRDKIVVVPTTEYGGPPGIAALPPPEFRSRMSSEITFVGPDQRLAFNGTISKKNFPSERDLVIQEGQYKLQEEIPAQPIRGLQTSISGTPFSDQVLVGTPQWVSVPLGRLESNAMTLSVRLPPKAPKPKASDQLELMPAVISGRMPKDPLLLLDRPPEGRRDRGEGLARVYIPRAEKIACSPDGSLVYVLDRYGLLRAFDTIQLREVRQATIPQASEDAWCELVVTNSGLLVSNGDEPWAELLDFTTLDGKVRYGFSVSGIRTTSPGSNLIRVEGESDVLELHDVSTGHLVFRQTEHNAAQMIDEGSRFRGNWFGESHLADSGKLVIVKFREDWRCFEIDIEDGWNYLGKLDLYKLQNTILPSPYGRACYCEYEDFASVFNLRSLPEPVTDIEFSVERRRNNIRRGGAEILAVASNNWLYVGVGAKLFVYNTSGKQLFAGYVLTDGSGNQVVPVPGRPTRIFALGDMFSVSDLNKPIDHYAGLRVWTNGKQQVVARALEADDEEVVLASVEDKLVTIPTERLSEEDRQYLEDLKRPKKRRQR